MEEHRVIYLNPNGKEYVIINNEKHFIAKMKKQPTIGYAHGKKIAIFNDFNKQWKKPHKKISHKNTSHKKISYKSPKKLPYKKIHNKKKPSYNKNINTYYIKSKTPVIKNLGEKLINNSGKNWKRLKPKPKELYSQFQKCGGQCFIGNEPICAKNTCSPNCDALFEINRKYPENNDAYEIAKSFNCSWTNILENNTQFSNSLYLPSYKSY